MSDPMRRIERIGRHLGHTGHTQTVDGRDEGTVTVMFDGRTRGVYLTARDHVRAIQIGPHTITAVHEDSMSLARAIAAQLDADETKGERK